MARGFFMPLLSLPAAAVNVRPGVAVGRFSGGGKRGRLQKQPPRADTRAVMNTANTQALPMRALYAPNPPQFDDPWMRALLVLLAVFGLAALSTLGS